MKVKILTDELLAEMIGLPNKQRSDTHGGVDRSQVLTSEYVSQFNRGVAYRIQQREASHIASADLAAKARFR